MVDLILVFVLIAYVFVHIQDGFLYLLAKLVSFVGSAVLAFLLYNQVSSLAAQWVTAPPGILDAASFIVLFILLQLILKTILWSMFSRIPEEMHRSSVSKILAVVPALFDGLILISLVLFLFVIMPFLPNIKRPIEESRLGNTLVTQASGIEGYLNQIFGGAAQETLGFLTIRPDESESVALPFKPTRFEIDEESEARMLELVNAERAKVGAKPLVMDSTLVEVARMHSEDMWRRQYFSHVNLDGETPFDRMREGGSRFRAAGENLALARTVGRAHEGLMDSPGHKRNILDPNFGRVGIGVIDAGIYGKMFTQNFAD